MAITGFPYHGNKIPSELKPLYITPSFDEASQKLLIMSFFNLIIFLLLVFVMMTQSVDNNDLFFLFFIG